ncbi:MAG: tripartite tricarboxylate transporter permease, partial [Desulfomicrobium sp.]|nr:tripartite tricarboxylate transporter permease [Desulfomicrobium sp.]
MDFITYFFACLTPIKIALMVGGAIGGILLGAAPGLSPTMAVALLVPFTFHMDPTDGLILLGAVYTAAVAGGSITAILINIPGAPANIATMFDGHAMAKNGNAEKALYLAFLSSGVGGLFGVTVLILFTPPIARMAMEFGPAELFWLAIFGVTVIAGLSSGTVVKGLYAGAFGLLISCIGENPVYGAERFVFSDKLTGGIAIIPALIGLFAIPQIFTLVETLGQSLQRETFKAQKGVLREAFRDILRHPREWLMGSTVGSFIGAIPGAGGQVAGLIAYDQAKKMSKYPERFGTGIPEGLISVESSNNATVGPAMIPLLTMGIPGSPTAAVLMGGLLIHGLFPGPELFTKHADVAYTFIASMIVAQIAMVVFGIMISRYSHIVMNIPNIFMVAAVTVLCVYGSYSVQNSMDDVIIMFSLGLIM